MLKKKFIDDGYVILSTNLNTNPKFLHLCNQIYNSLEKNLKNQNIKKLRGYIMGNLNVYPGRYGDDLLHLVKSVGIFKSIEIILDKKIEDLELIYGGNLCLAGKGQQNFHIDGGFNKEMYLMSVSTETINETNGPTEICIGSHKKYLPFWKFVLSKKNKKKIFLNKGDIILRKHSLWHRGTKNMSKKNRLLLSFIILPKNVNYQVRHKETFELSVLPNFFKQNKIGLIHEFIYSKFKILMLLIKFFKSAMYK